LFGRFLANTVLADEVWLAAISAFAKPAFAAEGAIALFWDERIEREMSEIGQARLRLGKETAPIKVTPSSGSPSEDILEGTNCSILGQKHIHISCCTFAS
jgi:hypothetical protein